MFKARFVKYRIATIPILLILFIWGYSALEPKLETGNVIFIHPDGTGVNTWSALRILVKGPDGMLNWDLMDELGVYRSHQLHAMGTSSQAGATVHAYGVKAEIDDYGIDPDRPVKSRSGKDYSIMIEAQKAGYAIGVINSGHLNEPGSGVFLASAKERSSNDEISGKIITAGADVILSGGEVYLIPEGSIGRFGKEGRRKDGRNLIEEARELGYTVVYDREELLNLPNDAGKVFGVFAAVHTFNARSEEDLAERNLPMYDPDAPTIAEMTDAAIQFLSNGGRPFFLVAEEEGPDNFGNNNHALGTLTALQRADEAIGVSLKYQQEHPNTLVIVASDSDAGGMQVHQIGEAANKNKPLEPTRWNGAPVDGIGGTGTLPFVAKPDQFGEEIGFSISWAAYGDVYGGVIARAHGLNADLLPVNVDNSDIYRVMYATLFGVWLE